MEINTNMNFDFLKYKNIFYFISGALVLASLYFIFLADGNPLTADFNFGIDFTQGSVMKVEYLDQRPASDRIKETLSQFDLGPVSLRSIDEKGVEITFQKIKNENEKDQIKAALDAQAKIDAGKTYVEEVQPVVGNIIKQKTMVSLVLSVMVVLFFIAFSFRGVSKVINSWYYGLAATIALCHDVIIPMGVIAFLGKYYGVQFTLPIVAALLTIFGYSVNDTIVVFDRIRENLLRRQSGTIEDIINKSINETWWRSLATTLTTMIPLFVLYFIGGDDLRFFSLTLLIGVFLGAYSSIFLASPLLLLVANRRVLTNKK